MYIHPYLETCLSNCLRNILLLCSIQEVLFQESCIGSYDSLLILNTVSIYAELAMTLSNMYINLTDLYS